MKLLKSVEEAMPVSINYAWSVTQFIGQLTAGQIQGVRPMAALATDVHLLYLAWGARQNVPVTPSSAWFCRFITDRHGVLSARKRYADGPVIRGPNSVLFLNGPVHARFGEEPTLLGEQVLAFRWQVERYADLQHKVQEQAAQVGAHVR